jgi:hypothetical protein
MAHREGPELEWKERLGAPFRVAATLCAFANGRGGVLRFGVRDDGEVVGVADPAAVRREVLRIAAERLVPPLAIAAGRGQQGTVDVRVAEAREKPVRVVRADGREVAYVRDGASSRPAGPAEERRLRLPGPRRGGSLGPVELRVLHAVRAGRGGATEGTLARIVRSGRRAVRRGLAALEQAGLVARQDGGRLWLTPAGHRAAGGSSR